MARRKRLVFVPRLMDEANMNPQSKNAQAILGRWGGDRAVCRTLCYNEPVPLVAANPFVRVHRLLRRHLWYFDAILQFQRRADLVFYADAHWTHRAGLAVRKLTGRKVPLIGTAEGFAGDAAREEKLSEWAGHRVYCQYVPPEGLAALDRFSRDADHIIAISPFIARMQERLYGEKVSYLPLGIDSPIFHDKPTEKNRRLTVIGCGRLYANKRPDVFIELASRYTDVDFAWYGWGELLEPLRARAEDLKLNNLSYPGPVKNTELADAFRKAHLFILPSRSEGVPKVTQEAAACGLPQVIFGFYEAYSVVDGQNGYVVWDDEGFYERVDQLLANPGLREDMGRIGAEMAKAWSWDILAPQWQSTILRFLPD